MISRRALLATGVAAGALTPAGQTSATAADGIDTSRIVEELRAIRQALSGVGPAPVEQVRQSQRSFVKNTGRYPEFIDVGYDVFSAAIDWLVSLQQPVTLTRQADARYTLAFFLTTLVLRTDFEDSFVGRGYDR